MTRHVLRGVLVALAVLLVSLIAANATTAAVQQGEGLSYPPAGVAGHCRKVPAGNYNVWLKTYAPISWEVICGRKRWSGELPATKIPFGYRWVPTIRKGDRYTLKTTLKDICTSPRSLGAGWSDICQVCRYADCSKVKIKGRLAVNKVKCLLGAYQAKGRGNIKLKYQGDGLGGCTIRATYRGRLMSSFVVGPWN